MRARFHLPSAATAKWWTFSHFLVLIGGVTAIIGLYIDDPAVVAIGAVVAAFGKFGVPYFDRKAKRDEDEQAAEEKARTSPFLLVSYHHQASTHSNDSVIVAFENTGNEPIQYFTAEIKSSNGNFRLATPIA